MSHAADRSSTIDLFNKPALGLDIVEKRLYPFTLYLAESEIVEPGRVCAPLLDLKIGRGRESLLRIEAFADYIDHSRKLQIVEQDFIECIDVRLGRPNSRQKVCYPKALQSAGVNYNPSEFILQILLLGFGRWRDSISRSETEEGQENSKKKY